MENKTTCFVIIGYGKKMSYANGKMRTLDLDQTYALLIKPVFEALNISCYRAIDKNLSGSIDKVMLQEIRNADIALVDISTLNANVMWELGVRHALKPHHTIMICEKEQMSSMPFDVNHFVVHQYTHSEEGIPYLEVERFRTQLTKIVTGIMAQKPVMTDSPVYTFLEDELKNAGVLKAEVHSDALYKKAVSSDSFATIMEKAEQAKNNKEYEKALGLLAVARDFASQNMTLKNNLSMVICRQALCTYKSKQPDELSALKNAATILEELQPANNPDIEVLGLSGAISKRMYEITDDMNDLNNAVSFYETGFQLKQDYYNGINAAFMLYKKASVLKSQNKDWEDIKVKADYLRNSVLEIAAKLEATKGFDELKDAVWILFTLAEAYNYKKNNTKMKEYEEKAKAIAEKSNDTFAPAAYAEQKEKIGAIVKQLQ